MTAPLVLFGAFDRHNLGDLLLAHVAQRTAAPRRCLFAGLRAADLRALGGFAVHAWPALLATWRRDYGAAPLELLHVGGEVLDTDAWEAAVMLLPAEEAAARVALLDRQPAARAVWAADFLGSGRLAPYVVAADACGDGGGVQIVSEFRAVGGVGLAGRPAAFQAEIVGALQAARAVTVRERTTQAALAALGVAAALEPDPVSRAAMLFAGEVAAQPRPPGDYLAVQCAASFADDATLAALARALDARALPVVLFVAGRAPWHDDVAVLQRLAGRLRVPATVAGRATVWESCALIAGARGCVASSLHALIVAGAFAVPALGIEARAGGAAKLRAYAATWGGFEVAAVAAVEALARRPVPGRTAAAAPDASLPVD